MAIRHASFMSPSLPSRHPWTPFLLRPAALVFSLLFLSSLFLTRSRLLNWESKLPQGQVHFRGRILDAGFTPIGEEGGRWQLILLSDGTPAMIWMTEGGRKGDWVEGRAAFELGQGSRNPGGFSRRNWLWSKGAAWTASGKSLRLIPQEGFLLDLIRIPDRLRDYVRCRHQAFWLSEGASLLLSLSLGDRSLMTDQEHYWLRTAGLSHLTSLSGTHLLFILGPFRRLWSSTSLPRKSRSCLMLPLICLPGILSGWKSGISRASIMALSLELDGPLGRHRPVFNSLFWAGALLLAIHPYAIYDSGFWMSLTTAAAVSWVSEAGLGSLRLSFRFSLAAQLVILPYQMMTAPGFQLLAPLANVLAIPLAALLMSVTYLGLALISLIPAQLPLAHALTQYLSSSLRPGVRLFEWLAARLASSRLAFIPLRWGLLFLPLLFLMVLVKKKGGLGKVLARTWVIIILLWFFLVILLFLPQGHQVIFLDVGQGDASLILTRQGQSILIDGGDKGMGYNTLIPAARMLGLAAIDLAILTHGHSDHALGLAELIEVGFIRHLCLPSYEEKQGPEDPQDLTFDLLALARSKGLPVSFLKRGDRLEAKDFSLEVLYPDRVPATRDLNRYSLVMKLTLDHVDLLMTGDLTAEGERSLQASGQDFSADILHLAHHGSGSSSTPAFLDLCQPQTALISLAARNRYGHPDPKVLACLADRGIKVLRTDQSGAVFLKIDRGKGRIRTWISGNQG